MERSRTRAILMHAGPRRVRDRSGIAFTMIVGQLEFASSHLARPRDRAPATECVGNIIHGITKP